MRRGQASILSKISILLDRMAVYEIQDPHYPIVFVDSSKTLKTCAIHTDQYIRWIFF